MTVKRFQTIHAASRRFIFARVVFVYLLYILMDMSGIFVAFYIRQFHRIHVYIAQTMYPMTTDTV